MFSFPIIQDKLFFEMTPMIPTREFSTDSGSFMPYALLRMAEINGAGIEIELTAFVTLPEVIESEDFINTDDLMAISINLNPEQSDTILTFICNAKNHCVLIKNGKNLGEFVCERRSGEDERGVYWSVTLPLSTSFLEEQFGVSSLNNIDHILCNAYKTKMKNPHKHFGAVAPFKNAYDLTSFDNLTAFKVISL